jgi:transcriptional regulator with XRE-family HTH domain
MAQTSGVGAKVRKLREERLWSQEKLAEVAEVSARTIQRLESEDKYSPHTLRAVSKALEIDANELTSHVYEDIGEFIERNKTELIPRVISEQSLCKLMGISQVSEMHNDDPINDEEMEKIGSFLELPERYRRYMGRYRTKRPNRIWIRTN